MAVKTKDMDTINKMSARVMEAFGKAEAEQKLSEKLNNFGFATTSEKIDGIFIAIGTAGGTDLATKMGVLMDNNTIVVNEKMETNVPGIYACGNITGGLLQVNKAAYEGAQAGLSAITYIKNK